MTGLDAIDHVVLLMLENRSFDHLQGYGTGRVAHHWTHM
jgi:phospholipase C